MPTCGGRRPGDCGLQPVHVTDADNDAMTYFLYDATPDASSGHFVVNGTAVAAGTPFAPQRGATGANHLRGGRVGDHRRSFGDGL